MCSQSSGYNSRDLTGRFLLAVTTVLAIVGLVRLKFRFLNLLGNVWIFLYSGLLVLRSFLKGVSLFDLGWLLLLVLSLNANFQPLANLFFVLVKRLMYDACCPLLLAIGTFFLFSWCFSVPTIGSILIVFAYVTEFYLIFLCVCTLCVFLPHLYKFPFVLIFFPFFVLNIFFVCYIECGFFHHAV